MAEQTPTSKPAGNPGTDEFPKAEQEFRKKPKPKARRRYRRKAKIVAALALLLSWPAEAHDWMPHETRWCCDNRDCHPHPKTAIERTDEGWQIVSSGQVFKDGERGIYPNYAPDVGEVWICVMPHEAPKARCIFILPEGS